MNLLANYWRCNEDNLPPAYHHTPPINLFYGLREGLAIIAAERLENTWARHARVASKLYDGLQNLGLEMLVENPKDRLPTVTTVKIPPGVDGKYVIQYAMDK